MHVAVTGASGFLGRALDASLTADGHRVTRLVRGSASDEDEISWDPEAGILDAEALRGVDAVVHLAGENITARRWSAEQKRRIRSSRTRGTTLVASALGRLRADGAAPGVLVSVSGINFYGDRGDEALSEDSGPGRGFLAGVVREWEAAADPAREAGVRVVHPRVGLVQGRQGGMLPRILPLYRLGLGGRLGSGRQYWSWIALDDVIGLMRHALESDDLAGPVNAVAPNPVTNAEYTRILAAVLGRPALLPVPRLAPALLYGRELVKELLYSSARVLPERASASGYEFRHATLEACLRDLLDRPADG